MRATPNLRAAHWRKSSYSGGQGGDECLEVADGIAEFVPVRDSKTTLAPGLVFTHDAWGAFVVALKKGTTPAV